MRAVPQIAVDFVAKAEAIRLTAYRDSIGVLTIGAGHTGPDVTPGKTITLEEAKELLSIDLEKASARIDTCMDHARGIIDAMSDRQYSALLSFVFNVGGDPKWTIWKVLKARQFDKVPEQLQRFVFAGGKRLPGLVSRRAAESALWASSIPAKPPVPVIGVGPLAVASAPVAAIVAHASPNLAPWFIAIALVLCFVGIVYLFHKSRKPPMPPSDAFNQAVANLVAAFNAKVAAASDTSALDAANAQIADLQGQLSTAQAASAQVDADDTAAVVAATPQ